MVTATYLASALVTGLLLLVVVVGVARQPNWRGAAAGTGAGGAAGADSGVTRGPAVAAVAAVLLVALVVALLAPGLAGGGAADGGTADGEGLPGGAAIVAVGAGLGLLTVTYLVWGVYHSTRYRGLTSAQAAGVGAWVFGMLVILGVLAVLLLG